jgi:hypothetical protein
MQVSTNEYSVSPSKFQGVSFNPPATVHTFVIVRVAGKVALFHWNSYSRIKSGADFVSTWQAPEFVIDGIFQKRYLYVITAPAGTGKTALAQLLAVSIAYGKKFGDHETTPGKVLYLAGENPDDIKTRWIALAQKLGIDPNSVDWIEGSFALTDNEALKMIKQSETLGQRYSAVLVDTSQAHFPGDDSNRNEPMKDYAKTLRRLTGLPGGPAVIVYAHPSKGGDPTRPYGGGSFFNEIDASAFLKKTKENGKPVIRLHPDAEKWRGERFKPIRLDLIEFDAPDLKDAKGRPIRSVMMEAWESVGIGFPDEPDDVPVTSISTSILTKSQKAILLRFRSANSKYTFAALKEATGVSDSTLAKGLNVLISHGYITKLDDNSGYVLLPKPTSKSKLKSK